MDAVSPVIKLHKNDLPAGLAFPDGVAIDSETMGLKPQRDRLCVVQLSAGDGTAHLVQFDGKDWSAPRLKALLADPAVLKIFHFARFDMAMLEHYLGVAAAAGLLHQDRLQAGPDLHRPPRPEGSVRRAAGRRAVQAAAELGLGRGQAHRPAEALCRVRRPASARLEGKARRHAAAGGPDGARRRPASASSARAPGSTWPASRTWTSLPIDLRGQATAARSIVSSQALRLPQVPI